MNNKNVSNKLGDRATELSRQDVEGSALFILVTSGPEGGEKAKGRPAKPEGARKAGSEDKTLSSSASTVSK